MSVVELSDEENVAILAETFTESLSALGDRSRKAAVLKRIHQLLESNAPRHYIHETVSGCNNLQVIRVGGDLRIYCRLIMGIPRGSPRYNVLFVFYVDPHRYRPDQLTRFDHAADRRLRAVTGFEGVREIDQFLTEMNAFTAGDIENRIDRLQQ